MNSNQLTCFLFNDLEPWERTTFEGLIEGLSGLMKIETIWVTESQRHYFRKQVTGNFWIISKNWRRACEFLSAKRYQRGKLFVTALDLNQDEKPLYGLSLQGVVDPLSKTMTLLVHSPTEFRFFKEIKKIPLEQLKLMALPAVLNFSKKEKPNHSQFVVGTLCHFGLESNIPFLLSVAHFVSKIDSQIQFRIMGRGPLYGHFAKLVNELGLENQVSIIETASDEAVRFLDLFVYSSIRAPHFIPVLVAAANKVGVLSHDVEDLKSWGQTGILLTGPEVKAMGNKILELKTDIIQRKKLADNLFSNVVENFSLAVISKQYQKLFVDNEEVVEEVKRAA